MSKCPMARMAGIVSGLILAVLMVLNCLIWVAILFPVALLRVLLPSKTLKRTVQRLIHKIPTHWTSINNICMSLLCPIEIDVRGTEGINPKGWYLITPNHQTWFDIVVLQRVFHKKTSPLRFFMKKELRWQLPVIAQACEILDYPFMNRYSKEYLKKHPEKKGKDIEVTRKACEKFKNIPTSMINFIEGGRFTEQKHERQKSPYKYLLKPKAGGIAFTLATMGEHMNILLDVTIVYPERGLTIWDILTGKINRIIVDVQQVPLKEHTRGNYQEDHEFRAQFQQWINELWKQKDARIERLQTEIATPNVSRSETCCGQK